MKEKINRIIEYITPYVQKITKWFKIGFVSHLVIEALVMLILVTL